MRLKNYSTTGIIQYMALKIRFCTLKFYLKNYISCGRKKKKKKSVRENMTRIEKGTDRQLPTFARISEKFRKLLDSSTLLKAWTPELKKTESLQAFVKFSYDCYVLGKRTIYLLMKRYGKKRYQETSDLFNAIFMREIQFQNR